MPAHKLLTSSWPYLNPSIDIPILRTKHQNSNINHAGGGAARFEQTQGKASQGTIGRSKWFQMSCAP